jgi:hypothetical protein
MALPGPGTPAYWATISWTPSGETDVSTEVYFGGPYGSPPGSGTLPLVGTVGPGVASLDVYIGLTVSGTYYTQVRHVRSGYTPSDLAPVTPLGVDGLP